MITLICGLGRCGTSLVLQMLHRGGIHCSGSWPMFEDIRQTRSNEKDWIREYEGAGLKWLDPGLYPPPHSCSGGHRFDYRAIWLDRCEKEQAKSFQKFQNAYLHAKTSRKDIPEEIKKIRDARAKAIEILNIATNKNISFFFFEDVLKNPRIITAKLKDFFPELNESNALSAVIKRRSGCMLGMLEPILEKVGPNWRPKDERNKFT